MAYCDTCKEEKSDNQKFCDSCGAELTASAPAESAVTASEPPPAPAQPVYTAEQFQQHKEQAMNIFSKLGIGLQIAAIGGIVSFVFSLITAIQISSSPWAAFAGAFLGGAIWFNVIAAAAVVALIYFSTLSTGKTKTLMIVGVIALGSIWIPGLFSYWGAGLYMIAMLGGIAEVVGGFIGLNSIL